MHIQRKFCQTFFILTTILSTDQLHIVAARTTLTLAVWVAGGGCGSPLAAVASMSLSADIVVVAVLMDICLSLCYRVKELKRAREHESDRKSPLTMWSHSPDSSFLFRFYPRHFTSERWGENKRSRGRCNYYYFCSVTGSTTTTTTCTTASIFFTYLFFPLTWFRMERDNSNGIMNYKGVRVGVVGEGGVQDICFLAFFALFHGFFWIQREGRQRGQQDMSVQMWRDGNRGCSRRSQRIERPRRNTLGSNCTSYFLSDRWINFKTFFFSYVLAF